nr:MAG TPA: hypothetical protein [Caudoviricetes sp.]
MSYLIHIKIIIHDLITYVNFPPYPRYLYYLLYSLPKKRI